MINTNIHKISKQDSLIYTYHVSERYMLFSFVCFYYFVHDFTREKIIIFLKKNNKKKNLIFLHIRAILPTVLRTFDQLSNFTYPQFFMVLKKVKIIFYVACCISDYWLVSY